MCREENTTATWNATQMQNEMILDSITASLGKHKESCHAAHTLYLNTDLSTQLL